MALPKKYRLKKRKDFAQVKIKGKLINQSLFGFLILEGQNNPFPVFGFIVSKKVSLRAVKRNRVRRLLAEAVYPLLPQVKPGAKIIILAKKGLVQADLEKVKKEVANVLKPFLQ